MRCKQTMFIVMLSTISVLLAGLFYAWRGIDRLEPVLDLGRFEAAH